MLGAREGPRQVRQRSLEAFSRSRYTARETLTGGLTVFSRKSDPQVRQGGLASFTRRPVLAEFRCMRGDACAAVQERRETGHERSLPRTMTTLVVLKASVDPHRGRVPQTRHEPQRARVNDLWSRTLRWEAQNHETGGGSSCTRL